MKVIPESLIEHFIKSFDVRMYLNESDVVYEGQIPFVAFLILHGSAVFLKRNKQVKNAGPGEFVALPELIKNVPLNYSIKINPNSKVCVIDRSTILEIKEKQDCDSNKKLIRTLFSA